MTNLYGLPIERVSILFCILFALSTALTLPLFRFDLRAFISSRLFIKILLWLPIFLIFVTFLYLPGLGRLIVICTLLLLVLREVVVAVKTKGHLYLVSLYYLIFSFALLHFYFLGLAHPKSSATLLIAIAFASVLSDVVAFFLGNYLGKHKLPSILNSNKSWEGVFGQFLGAFIGTLLVWIFITQSFSRLIFLPIGIGSAAGDLLNSFVKRKLDIKEWSNGIPGHGGYLDRLSSLACAVIFTFYYLYLIYPRL
ncbi:MAG TPA: phosphatidate cytidylyltransferase [Candidatus Saccharimonadales bacterium]|nr:phosphatidate cytidylyltransferase [Candidatus Saccharimonadales bacterium]